MRIVGGVRAVSFLVLWLVLTARPVSAATITVTSAADDAADDGVCTLREAIAAANQNTASGASNGECAAGDPSPAADTIAFAIPGAGVHTITLASTLTVVAELATIDGYTQRPCASNPAPCSQPNTNATGAINAVPLIELDCNEQSSCLTFLTPATVRGLVVNGCPLGGRCIFDLGGSTIAGNFIGTDPTGTASRSNGSGVAGGSTIIGGTTPADRNLISGNAGSPGNQRGIDVLTNVETFAPVIKGNLIGTDKTGTVAVPNGIGISLASFNGGHIVATIGGAVSSEGNVVSGNGMQGIFLGHLGGGATLSIAGSTVVGNLIGTDASGAAPLGNGSDGGIAIQAAGPATVEANAIAFNGGPGIVINDGSGMRIRLNTIFANAGLGIDLSPPGVNQNDATPGDPDAGANDGQNFPVLDTPVFPGGSSIGGTLNSIPGHSFRIEVFANGACDPLLAGEGQTFVGTVDTGPTNGNGDVSFTVSFGQTIGATLLTATATDLTTNDTSELSACPVAPPTPTPKATRTATPIPTLTASATPTATPTGGLAASATPTSTPTVAGVPLGHFVGYQVKVAKSGPKFFKLGPVTLADPTFGFTADYDVLKPNLLALPANKNGEGFTDPATHLVAYAVKLAKGSPKFSPRADFGVVNQCGDLVVTAKKPVSILVPSRVLDADRCRRRRARAERRRSFPLLPGEDAEEARRRHAARAVPQRRAGGRYRRLSNPALRPEEGRVRMPPGREERIAAAACRSKQRDAVRAHARDGRESGVVPGMLPGEARDQDDSAERLWPGRSGRQRRQDGPEAAQARAPARPGRKPARGRCARYQEGRPGLHPVDSRRASAASAVMPRFPLISSFRRARVQPKASAKAVWVIPAGARIISLSKRRSSLLAIVRPTTMTKHAGNASAVQIVDYH